jgi:hypothetical protein
MEKQKFKIWFEIPNSPTIQYKETFAYSRLIAEKKMYNSFGKTIKINLIK